MLIESSGPPQRVPWVNAPGGVPVGWVRLEGGATLADLAPGGPFARMLEDSVGRIPSSIRDAFVGKQAVGAYVFPTATLRVFLVVSPDFLISSGFLSGQYPLGFAFNGVYISPRAGDRFSTSFLSLDRVTTIVHEFGHHVDATYNRFWPGASGSVDPLTVTGGPLQTLYAAALPTIPNGLYGATNVREWFAELWVSFIVDDPVMVYNLAGQSTSRMAQIDTALRALLPALPTLSPRAAPTFDPLGVVVSGGESGAALTRTAGSDLALRFTGGVTGARYPPLFEISQFIAEWSLDAFTWSGAKVGVRNYADPSFPLIFPGFFPPPTSSFLIRVRITNDSGVGTWQSSFSWRTV